MGDFSIVSVGTFCDGCQALVPMGAAFSERQQVLCPFTCGHGLCGNCLICPYKQISLWGCPVCGCKDAVKRDDMKFATEFGQVAPQPTDSFDSISDLDEIITPGSLIGQASDFAVEEAEEEDKFLRAESEVEVGYLSTHPGAFQYQEESCDSYPLTMKEERHPKAGKGNSRPMRSPARKLECKKIRDAKNQTRRSQYAVVGSWVGLGAFVAWGRGTLGNKDFSYAWE